MLNVEDFVTLSNEEKIALHQKWAKRSDDLFRSGVSGDLKERNKLCEPLRKLYREIDWGFKVGEHVRVAQGNRNVNARILEITEENSFLIAKESGGKVKVPGSLLRKMDEIEVHSEPLEQIEKTDIDIPKIQLVEQLELQLF